jgi:hypothetical protein
MLLDVLEKFVSLLFASPVMFGDNTDPKQGLFGVTHKHRSCCPTTNMNLETGGSLIFCIDERRTVFSALEQISIENISTN